MNTKKIWVLRAPDPWSNTYEKLENLGELKIRACKYENGHKKNGVSMREGSPTYYEGPRKVF